MDFSIKQTAFGGGGEIRFLLFLSVSHQYFWLFFKFVTTDFFVEHFVAFVACSTNLTFVKFDFFF